jgi:hypothetical protein
MFPQFFYLPKLVTEGTPAGLDISAQTEHCQLNKLFEEYLCRVFKQ